VTQERAIDVKQMEAVLRLGADRCCYCQRRDGYTLANPKVQVAPPVGGPALVAHAQCDEPVQAWRRSRM